MRKLLRGAIGAEPVAAKVPEVIGLFWVMKVPDDRDR
jgi:hypothetical protein